jgi:PAS domain S-box-containing protein
VARIKQQRQNELAAIMELKIGQIVNWRRERLGNARVIFEDRFLAQRIKDYLEGRGGPELKEEILGRLAALMIYQYQKIILVRGPGEVELTYPGENRACDTYSQKLVAKAMQSQEIIFSDFYRDDVSNEIRLSLVIPILAPHDHTPVAVILLKIDPRQFLDPLIQTWPTPSRTAETILFRVEGGEVVYLNELRFQKGSALTLHFPLRTSELDTARVARGDKGEVLDGKDYRGVRVESVGDRVPDSPWFLLAKVDRQEIFAPLVANAWMTAFLLVLLVASSGLGLAFIWRNQQAAFYLRQLEAERDKLALAQRYEYVTQYANDIILLADEDLRIFEANARAVESYGYGREELLRLTLADLLPPETRPLLAENLQQAGDRGGLIFEAGQRRQDGTTFPGEISLRHMEVAGRQVYQEIIRDVTLRKLGEEALRASEKSLRHLAGQLLTAQESERQRISLMLHDELGQALMLFKFQINTLRDKLHQGKNAAADDCLEILQYLDGLINRVRQLSHDLNPPDILEDLGFQPAVQDLIEEFSKFYHIEPAKVAIDEIKPLFSREALISIYRIFQECLLNIGKHAQATRISINVKKEGGQVSFMIQDNGRGFDMQKLMRQNSLNSGLGIPSIQERVKILGGSIDIWSEPKKGTKISFILPIKTG